MADNYPIRAEYDPGLELSEPATYARRRPVQIGIRRPSLTVTFLDGSEQEFTGSEADRIAPELYEWLKNMPQDTPSDIQEGWTSWKYAETFPCPIDFSAAGEARLTR